MSSPFHKGEWFLPGSKLKLPGRLMIDETEHTIRLELFGNRYLDDQPVVIHDPERSKLYHSKLYNEHFAEKLPLILGQAAGLVTLYRCRYHSVEDISNDLYVIQYQVEYVFWGAHILSLETFLLRSATFIYPYLSSWYEGWNSQNKLKRGEESFSFEPPPTSLDEPIAVRDGLSIQLTESQNKTSKNLGIHEELRYQMYLTFNYAAPTSFDEVLFNARILGKLLEFCHGKPMRKAILSILIDKDLVLYDEHRSHSRVNEPVQLRITNFSLPRGEDVYKHTQHQRYMLLSGWIMDQKELHMVIQQWFANTAFYGLYDLYLDSNNWYRSSGATLSNVMFNNKFLNIVQGLEAYCRKSPVFAAKKSAPTKPTTSPKEFEQNKKAILKKLEKGPLKAWFNGFFNYKPPRDVDMKLEDILSEIITKFEPVLTPLLGKNEIIDFFPRFAAVTRNNLSHGTHVKTDQGDALTIFFHAGQILLAICILQTLGIADISEKIKRYDSFQRTMHQLRRAKLIFK